MKHMNIARRFSGYRTAAVLGLTGMVASTMASAGPLADAITTEITTAKAEILLVGVAVLALVGVLLLIKSVRKAAH